MLLDYLSKSGESYWISLSSPHRKAGIFLDSVFFSSLPQGRLFSCLRTGKASNFCRVYRYGPQVRVVYFKRAVALAGFESDAKKEQMFAEEHDSGDRYESNIIRAKSKILEFALCNPWDNFVTLTLDPLKYDRYNLHGWKKDLSQWIRDQRKRGCGNLRYLLIPETHKDGAWHMHGLFEGIPSGDLVKNGNGYLDWPRYRKKFGFISLDPVRNKVAVSKYITKYIKKGTEATATELETGRHLYYHSAGLRGRELILEGEVVAPEKFWQWENDYVKSTWMEVSEFERCIFSGDCGKNA